MGWLRWEDGVVKPLELPVLVLFLTFGELSIRICNTQERTGRQFWCWKDRWVLDFWDELFRDGFVTAGKRAFFIEDSFSLSVPQGGILRPENFSICQVSFYIEISFSLSMIQDEDRINLLEVGDGTKVFSSCFQFSLEAISSPLGNLEGRVCIWTGALSSRCSGLIVECIQNNWRGD